MDEFGLGVPFSRRISGMNAPVGSFPFEASGVQLRPLFPCPDQKAERGAKSRQLVPTVPEKHQSSREGKALPVEPPNPLILHSKLSALLLPLIDCQARRWPPRFPLSSYRRGSDRPLTASSNPLQPTLTSARSSTPWVLLGCKVHPPV